MVTDSPAIIDDDIYQLSKFALIINVNSTENNQIFEMHDVVAQKVLEIDYANNELLLKNMMLKINEYYQQMNKALKSAT